MLPVDNVLEQARKARDPRFDGRFFVGVKTTGVYCRPVCPVKLPRAENVTFYGTAAAASEAGFRPCLRCRPETSPGTPAWMGTSTTVNRALRLIGEGALDDGSIAQLSDRLGVTTRHLSRLFAKHLGASPNTIAQTRRLQFAKRLIDETNMAMTDVAMSAGYGSIRRFNDHFRQTYKRSPGSLRKDRPGLPGGVIEMRLMYREPYDFDGLLAFYSVRGIPGVEEVTTDSYSRSFLVDGEAGRLWVSRSPSARTLLVQVQGAGARSLMKIIDKVRRMFDVDAIPEEINSALAQDEDLRRLMRDNPGQRLPGAFDEFEIAVRAIVGQQVSVKGATTVMGKIVSLYGDETEYGRVFPTAGKLSNLDPELLPMPRSRANAIKSLAQEVAGGRLALGGIQDSDDFQKQLLIIPGIGPWTSQYIAMRVLADPDVFLHGDLVIKKVAAKQFGITSERELISRAEQWRPWRAYAGMHLWRNAANS